MIVNFPVTACRTEQRCQSTFVFRDGWRKALDNHAIAAANSYGCFRLHIELLAENLTTNGLAPDGAKLLGSCLTDKVQ